MARAKRNPRGFRPPPGSDVEIVRVGQGHHTHLWNPNVGWHACMSGVNSGKDGKGYPTVWEAPGAKTITCYRCAKLAMYNMQKHGTPNPQAQE